MRTATTNYRLGVALAVATLLFLIWGIGALGIIGEGGRPDRMYVVVVAVLVIGAVVVRGRPRGMAVVLLATALSQVLVAVIALLLGFHDTEGASVVEILGLNAMYAALFGGSAWLFWSAAQDPSPLPVRGRA